MSERDFKAKLKAELKKKFPDLIVFAHNDMVTAGIPDLSVSDGKGCTVWIEAKESTNKKVNRLQDETLRRLKGLKITYFKKSKLVAFVDNPTEGKFTIEEALDTIDTNLKLSHFCDPS